MDCILQKGQNELIYVRYFIRAMKKKKRRPYYVMEKKNSKIFINVKNRILKHVCAWDSKHIFEKWRRR